MFSDKKIINITSTDFKLLASMLNSGISAIQAFDHISESKSVKQKEGYIRIINLIEQGNKFSEIFKNTNLGKNKLFINLISNSENSGNLPEIIDVIANNIEKNKERSNQILGIMIYPAIVSLMVIGLILSLLLFIVPNIMPVLAISTDQQILATKALVFSSNILRNSWMEIIAICTGSGLALIVLSYVRVVRIMVERIVFKLPILGYYFTAYLSLSYTLSIYQFASNNPDLYKVLDDISESTKVEIYKRELKIISEKIRSGITLNLALSESKVIPSTWALFASVAEKSSSYEEMFKNLNKFYEEIFENYSKLIMRIAEPALMIFIGLIVGVLAYGIMAPLYGIMNTLG